MPGGRCLQIDVKRASWPSMARQTRAGRTERSLSKFSNEKTPISADTPPAGSSWGRKPKQERTVARTLTRPTCHGRSYSVEVLHSSLSSSAKVGIAGLAIKQLERSSFRKVRCMDATHILKVEKIFSNAFLYHIYSWKENIYIDPRNIRRFVSYTAYTRSTATPLSLKPHRIATIRLILQRMRKSRNASRCRANDHRLSPIFGWGVVSIATHRPLTITQREGDLSGYAKGISSTTCPS